jgi:perosamine synthetase
MLLESRKRIAGWYETYLTHAACRLPSDSPGRSWFVYVIEISDDYPANTRDNLIESLFASGVQSAPYFPSIHTQPFYKERFGYTVGDFPRTEHAAAHTIALPFFPDLTEEQVQFVAESITSLIPQL